jgi:sugar transferase EpsL
MLDIPLRKSNSIYVSHIKSVIDRVLAFALLILLMPLLLIIASVIWLSMGSPVVFRQERAGLSGKPFLLFKFRTMRSAGSEESTNHSTARVTRLGNLLRRFSLDELPQLVNILLGDMSFVGPRPLFVRYNELYNQRHRKRLAVKPGLTGWAQVNGRNQIGWSSKFDLDVVYVEHQSFFFDLRILMLTVVKVFNVMQVNNNNETAMPEFKGY